MEIKQVPTNTITRNLSELAKPTGNIYETVMIIAKRANQISANVKQELSQKLEEFSNYADTLEETFENREQIEISKHYGADRDLEALRETSQADACSH